MINTTDKVIVKANDVAAAIAQSRLKVDALMTDRYGSAKERKGKQWFRCWETIRDALQAEEHRKKLIEELMQVAEGGADLSNGFANKIGLLGLSRGSTKTPIFKTLTRYMIFTLWGEDSIILPLSFSFHHSIPFGDRALLGGEFISFLIEFEPTEDDVIKYGKSVYHRIRRHSQSWVMSTDWHKIEDISVGEAYSFHQIMTAKKRDGEASLIPTLRGLILELLLSRFPERTSYDRGELDNAEKAYESSIRDVLASRHLEGITKKRGPQKTAVKIQRAPSEKTDELLLIVKYRDYFVLPDHLVDTAYGVTEEEADVWVNLFNKWLNYRQKIQGYEDTRSPSRAMRVLADYISVGLPEALMEAAYDKGRIVVPKDFKRYPFIDQAAETLPFPTFLEFLEERSDSPDSRRGWIGHVCSFCEWLNANYSTKEHKDIVGPTFRVPIERKLDMPRVKKKVKTNKKPFGVRVTPHLLKWLYAIEEFGMHLQAIGEDLANLDTYDEVECDHYGLVPSYDFLGTKHDVTRAPVALLKSLGSKAGVNLTGLRLFLLTFEVGVRVQSTQWLDRRTWDQCNEDVRQDQEVFTLYVNTDKTHDEWETSILSRTRQLLLREQSYQESLGIPWREEPYEGRTDSRFPDIEPLFRDITNSRTQIITDSKYDDLWNHILFPFQRYAMHANLKLPLLCKYEMPKTIVISKTSDGFQKVNLKEKTLHTPHSCRSTYVSRRSSLISLDDIAAQVGHTNSVTTSHYNYTEFDELSKKLEHADDAIMSGDGGGPQVTSGPAFIKAKDVNSALRQSFNSDRDETISRYKMISLSASHGPDDDVESGLDMLRASRANEIKWDDTHICPVGGECPEEVIAEAREARRCGACQYACKTIENLPHIAAKRKSLKAQIIDNSALYHVVKNDPDRQGEADEIIDRIQADTYEYYGWAASEDVLNKALERGEDASYLHTQEPEIVQRHLKRVVKESTLREFVLERIVEAKDFPALRTDELRVKAGRLMRSVMAASNDALPDFFDSPDPDVELKLVAHAITSRMKAEGLSISQVSDALDRPVIEAPNVPIITAKAGE